MSDFIPHVTVLSAPIRERSCKNCKLYIFIQFTQDWRFLSHFFHVSFLIFTQCGRLCSKILSIRRSVPKIHAFKRQKWKYPFKQGLFRSSRNICFQTAAFHLHSFPCVYFDSISAHRSPCPTKIFQTVSLSLKFPDLNSPHRIIRIKKDRRNKVYSFDLFYYFLLFFISQSLEIILHDC